MTQISPMLAVGDPRAAIAFYKLAFGAEETWRIEAPNGGPVVCGMRIDGAEFFLASENPPSTLGPSGVGGTTVRIELFVENPHAVFDRAVAAGARKGSLVVEHAHATSDGGGFRMLQGGVVDPFGHVWLIGKFL